MFNLFSKDPYELNWGNVTPDGFNEEKKEVINIFNFDISSAEKISRCVIFSVGKIIWINKHIIKGTKQKVIFDLRGQPITFLDRARKMKQDILKQVTQIKPDVIVDIEILI
jgi:hypothetical protein